MSNTRSAASDLQRAGALPEELGVGMRLSVHPHCDDFVEVILGALRDARAAGLEEGLVVETDEVSTYVGARVVPAEARLLGYAAGLVAAAYRRTDGGHVVAHVLLSRGCPGEVSCDLGAVGLPAAYRVEMPSTGLPAVAQWSLYPMLDIDSAGDSDGDHGGGSHMAHIESAIASARASGIAAVPAHYATKLTGDLGAVLATAGDAWVRVGAAVRHVVSHLTVSVGSPSCGEGHR